ncbi:hypothetical protein BKP45_05975 [Anaerobacillus alkalidiazotrophicus]|uniref:N-acetyltransferase domain-containing protein n=1 Tax=Anaerobacillus alkalidiazotrophicus TaxID=472963 RepID=A0A1S2MCB4_9BACI|nr:GNAT family N-acetyltransferase [Anaerobacillus alkalidiazotrophicus]OIJ22214.1 hypothetical protein BKP45_05975 [Anaerobacillus alkalidiazotrophicus]
MLIRKATIDDWKGISSVHVDCMHAAYQEILPPDVLNKFTYTNRETRWKNDLPNTIRGGTMNFVLEDDDKIVGFALGGTMRDARLRIRYTGELYGIYVHPEVQGQGFGKKLFERVAQHLASIHHSSMALWTFKNHQSCSFLEYLGGEEVYEKNTTVAGNELKECAYGWDDLKAFIPTDNSLNL